MTAMTMIQDLVKPYIKAIDANYCHCNSQNNRITFLYKERAHRDVPSLAGVTVTSKIPKTYAR